MALFNYYTKFANKWQVRTIVVSPHNIIGVTKVPAHDVLPDPKIDDAFSLLSLNQPLAIELNNKGEPQFTRTLLVSGDYRSVSLLLGLDTTGEIRDIINFKEQTI